MNIIDFHAHAFPDAIAKKARDFLENYYHLPMYGNGTLDDLIASSREGGVTRLVVCSTATAAKQVTNINNWLAAAQKQNPYLVSLGTLHPDFEDIYAETDRIAELGLHGVKLHPDFQHADALCPGMLRIYDACQGRLPVLIHVGDRNTVFSKPAKIAKVLEMFPRLTVIAAHMGGYSEWADAEKYIIGKNCYIDTSSSFCGLSYDEMARLIRKHGAQRVLFGTDYPLACAKEELERFYRVPLTSGEQEAVLGLNAMHLLGLK